MKDHGDRFKVSNYNDHDQFWGVWRPLPYQILSFFVEEEKKIEVIDLTDLDD